MSLIKNFISVKDVDDVSEWVDLAEKLKADPYAHQHLGKNKTLGIIFFNPSLRTRLSTQKAATNLGMNVMVMNFNGEGWQLEMEDGAVMNGSSQEHVSEAAAVISQYCDIIAVRTFATLTHREEDYAEKFLSAFVKYARVPVVSLESATLHPLQSLADMLTLKEQKTTSNPKVVLSWAPHPKALPQAVANSFAQWTVAAGYDLTIAHPPGYELHPDFTGGATITHDQEEALKDADFVYVKNWSSYQNYGQATREYDNWTLDAAKMAGTNNAKFMHCLPIRRNVIATDEVIDAPTSLILEQANNRTYAAQAVLHKLLSNEG